MEYNKNKCVKVLMMALMGYEHKSETLRPTSRSPRRWPRKDKRLQRLELHVWQLRFISEEKTDRSKWDVNKTRPGAERRQEQKNACKTFQLTGAGESWLLRLAEDVREGARDACACGTNPSFHLHSTGRWRAARWARCCDQCLRSAHADSHDRAFRPTLHDLLQRFYTLAHTSTPLN